MEFSAVAVERAMTYHDVIMRALAGTWTWLKAADVLDIHPRSLRRWRARYERDPVLGLLDRRRRRPSHRTAPGAEAQRGLPLYRARYQGFTSRHFSPTARRAPGRTPRNSLWKPARRGAAPVPKAGARAPLRGGREPRPCV